MPQICLLSLMYICRLLLFLPFKQSSSTATLIVLTTNLLVNTTTVNCQLSGFDKKDIRGIKVANIEPFLELYTTPFIRFSTIHFSFICFIGLS